MYLNQRYICTLDIKRIGFLALLGAMRFLLRMPALPGSHLAAQAGSAHREAGRRRPGRCWDGCVSAGFSGAQRSARGARRALREPALVVAVIIAIILSLATAMFVNLRRGGSRGEALGALGWVGADSPPTEMWQLLLHSSAGLRVSDF